MFIYKGEYKIVYIYNVVMLSSLLKKKGGEADPSRDYLCSSASKITELSEVGSCGLDNRISNAFNASAL